MPIRNQHWYTLNEGRKYPLDDRASALSDAGDFLPTALLADLQLAYPRHLGRFPFLSSIASTPGLVTLTLQAADAFEDDASFTPLATIAVPRATLDERRPYPLDPQTPGVGGWVAFGSGTREHWTGRLSTPAQGLLTPRTARAYRSLPISSLGKLGLATSLTGLVRLTGENPIEIVATTREIDGVERDVIVIRLREDPTRLQTGVGDSVFREFAGPCAGRPDSRTCGDPQPIEFIGSVGPNCDGVIELVFRGCAVVGRNSDDCGIVVDCRFGLSDSCRPPYLPDSEGRLPSEVEPNIPTPPLEPEPEVPDESESVSATVVGELPFCHSFDDGVGDFIVIEGGFDFQRTDAPDEPCGELERVSESLSFWDVPAPWSWGSLAAGSSGQRNLAIWDGFDVSTLYRRVTATLQLLPGPSGARHSAGLVLGRRPHETLSGRWVYYAAEIDYDVQEVRIVRFNGTSFVTAVAVTIPGISLETWYRLTVDVVPGFGVTTKLTVRVEDVVAATTLVTLGPLSVSNYLPGDGRFGLLARRTRAAWSYFRVEET